MMEETITEELQTEGANTTSNTFSSVAEVDPAGMAKVELVFHEPQKVDLV